MASPEQLTSVQMKQHRLDILESLRSLSPEGVVALADAAKRLIEQESTEEALNA